MSDKPKVSVGQAVKLTDNKWLNLFEVPFTAPDGVEGRWTFASRKSDPAAGPLPLKPDAVVIVPLVKDGRKRRLAVIREFRIPLGDYEYGFPAGLYDEFESAEAVAKRELAEETGLKLTKVLHVTPPCVSSAGLSDESAVYVICECEGPTSSAGNQDAEDITVEVLDLEGVKALRSGPHKLSAKCIGFLLMFEGLGKIAWPRRLSGKANPT